MRLAGVCLIALLLWGDATHGSGTVVLRNLEKPGAVAVENHGATIRLRKRIVVEQMQEGTWQSTGAYVDLVEHCTTLGAPENCVTLRAGAKLTLVPWNGVSCDGQCTRPCRSNSYLGPGKFRFVLETCDRKKRFGGEPFELGAKQ